MEPNLTPSSRPKLDRLNAAKNFDYHPSSSFDYHPSSSSYSLDVSPRRFRSLPLDSKSSFRINGVDGEFDLICQTLGFSGPDDFAIPTAVWESQKARRSSFDTPSNSSAHQFQATGSYIARDSRLNRNFDASRFQSEARVSSENEARFSDKLEDKVSDLIFAQLHGGVGIERNGVSVRTVRDRSVAGYIKGDRPPVLAPPPGMMQRPAVDHVSSENEVRFSDKLEDEVSDLIFAQLDSGVGIERNGVSVRTIRDRSVAGGIKGDRPPVLAPPPGMVQRPADDHVNSSWDLLKSFAPVDDKDSDSINQGDQVIEENKEAEDSYVDEEVDQFDRTRVEESEILSEPCTSNGDFSDGDDDVNAITGPTLQVLHCISPNASFRRNFSSWQKGEHLGSGSFGTVFEGFTDDGFFFAVKEVSLLDHGSQGKQSILQLEQEISLLREFEHENIVRYLGTDKDEAKLYIFLELATKGSLARLYQKYNLRDSQVSAYTRQILNGLRYLHDRGVVHRDIKCANILVDANGSVKLADFGLAKATRTNDIKSCKGTAFWMAPEVVNLRNRTYGLAADIWSLGCTVLEMLTGRPPYSHLEGMQALFKIGKGEPPLVPDSLSKEAQDFILKCLQVNPNNRPTAVQLLSHPFVKRPIQPFLIPPSPRFINSPEKSR